VAVNYIKMVELGMMLKRMVLELDVEQVAEGSDMEQV